MVSALYRWILQVAHAKVYVPAWLWCFANNSPIWKLVLYSSTKTTLLLNKKFFIIQNLFQSVFVASAANADFFRRQRTTDNRQKTTDKRPQVNKSTRLCRLSLKGSTISGPTGTAPLVVSWSSSLKKLRNSVTPQF